MSNMEQAGAEPPVRSNILEFAYVQQMAELLECRRLTRLELRSGQDRLVLERQARGSGEALPEGDRGAAGKHSAVAAGTSASGSQDAGPSSPEAYVMGEHLPAGERVYSPILATGYRAKEPGAEPFVQVGSKVKAGDTICLLSAMKMIYEISSPIDGTVQGIYFEDGGMVEYNGLLFIIGWD